MTYAVLARDGQARQLGAAVACAAPGVGRVSPWGHRLFPRFAASSALVLTHGNMAPPNAHRLFELLADGRPLADAEAELRRFDPHFDWRQTVAMTARGEQWVATGGRCDRHHGDVSGRGWIVAGTALASPAVLEAMTEVMATTDGQPLAERLVFAIEAGRLEGGGWHQASRRSVAATSSVLYVVGDGASEPLVDLRVDQAADAVTQLRRLFEDFKPNAWLFPHMSSDPSHVDDEARRRGMGQAADMPTWVELAPRSFGI